MKIGIITFQETNNYGAILQNYALQQALIKLGVSAETIDYRSEYISKPYRLRHLIRKGLPRYLFGLMGYIFYQFRSRRNRRFRENISYSRPVASHQLKSLNDEYDLFITGSDQVWNYKLTGYDEAYCLGFVTDNRKKTAYAASLGIKEIPEDCRQWYLKELTGYKGISVRENSAGQQLSSILSRRIITVLDPVLLLNRSEWEKCIPKRLVSEKYILVYQLGVSRKLVSYAVNCAKQHKCRLVFVPFPLVGLAKGSYKLTAGAGELLNYLYYAEYVITDSFHGTALSILFNKAFTTLTGGSHSGVSSRIIDMLRLFGLEDHMWNEEMDLDAPIDWELVNQVLERERNKSYDYLRQIIEV